MNYQTFLPFLLFIITSCNVEMKQTQSTKENWLSFHHIDDNIFHKDKSFKIITSEKVQYGLWEKDRQLFKPTFRFSADSNYYVDMDSYGLELNENESGELEYLGREVDIKVYLVKTSEEDSLALELLMCGTSCFPEEAYWESKSIVSILGTYYDESEVLHPAIWRYNLNLSTFEKYISDAVIQPQNENYFEKYKLSKILSTK